MKTVLRDEHYVILSWSDGSNGCLGWWTYSYPKNLSAANKECKLMRKRGMKARLEFRTKIHQVVFEDKI